MAQSKSKGGRDVEEKERMGRNNVRRVRKVGKGERQGVE